MDSNKNGSKADKNFRTTKNSKNDPFTPGMQETSDLTYHETIERLNNYWNLKAKVKDGQF